MAEIINLASFRPDPNAPDPDCVVQDRDGRDMFRFSLAFEHAGSEWTVHIWAYDFPDAEDRVASMRASMQVAGQTLSIVQA